MADLFRRTWFRCGGKLREKGYTQTLRQMARICVRRRLPLVLSWMAREMVLGGRILTVPWKIHGEGAG